jgi:hypothetical protein
VDKIASRFTPVLNDANRTRFTVEITEGTSVPPFLQHCACYSSRWITSDKDARVSRNIGRRHRRRFRIAHRLVYPILLRMAGRSTVTEAVVKRVGA